MSEDLRVLHSLQKWELALCPFGPSVHIIFMKETPTDSRHAPHAAAAEQQLLTGGEKCEDNCKEKKNCEQSVF